MSATIPLLPNTKELVRQISRRCSPRLTHIQVDLGTGAVLR
jgi:hypothetical protein